MELLLFANAQQYNDAINLMQEGFIKSLNDMSEQEAEAVTLNGTLSSSVALEYLNRRQYMSINGKSFANKQIKTDIF